MTETDVSIVIPTYNRPKALASCLASLRRLHGGPYEMIVVNDGGSLEIEDICARYGARHKTISQSGPAAARNVGVEIASGSFIAFTDDDCCPEEDWIVEMRAAHQNEENSLVGGAVHNLLDRNPFSSASQMLCEYLYDYFGAMDGTMPFFTSNNMSCCRETFLRIGGFDPDFPRAAAEDRDFGRRWRAAQGELIYAPLARVGHAHDLDLRGFMRQHNNYGRGARHLHQQISIQGGPRIPLEPLSFYGGLLAYPIKRDGVSGVVGSSLMLLSQAAMVMGYVYEVLDK